MVRWWSSQNIKPCEIGLDTKGRIMNKQQYKEIRQTVRGNGLAYAIRHVSDYMQVAPFVTLFTAPNDELAFRARYFASPYHSLDKVKVHIKLFPLHWQA